MKNFNEFINEAVNYKDRSGKPFKIKGIDFVYTEQGGRFYGTSLYDVAKTANVNKRSKIDYEDGTLDKICKELKKKGIVCDHGDYMDVS